MNDKEIVGNISALTTAYIELVTALGRAKRITVSSLAATLEQRALPTNHAETKSALLAIAYALMHPS